MDSSLNSFSINKYRKHLLANATLQAILHNITFPLEYINKYKECSKNCYCQYHNDINVLLATLYATYV